SSGPPCRHTRARRRCRRGDGACVPGARGSVVALRPRDSSPVRCHDEAVTQTDERDAGNTDASAAARVLHHLESTHGWREDFYKHLHANPELSMQETATAAEVAGRLRSWGY